MTTEAIAAADSYKGVKVAGWLYECDQESCWHANVVLEQSVPEYELAMRQRFDGRVLFTYGRFDPL